MSTANQRDLFRSVRIGKTEDVIRCLEVEPEAKAIASEALFEAAMAGQAEVIQVLLQYDADPNCKDRDGRCPIDYAREAHKPECALLLSDQTEDPWSKSDRHFLISVDPELTELTSHFIGRAFQSGERGFVQGLVVEAPLPLWYRNLIAALPLSGISFKAEFPERSYPEEGVFLGKDGFEEIVSDDEELLKTLRQEYDVYPFALGSDGNYWILATQAGHTSPVNIWDSSGMQVVSGHENFCAFIKSIKPARESDLFDTVSDT